MAEKKKPIAKKPVRKIKPYDPQQDQVLQIAEDIHSRQLPYLELLDAVGQGIHAVRQTVDEYNRGKISTEEALRQTLEEINEMIHARRWIQNTTPTRKNQKIVLEEPIESEKLGMDKWSRATR